MYFEYTTAMGTKLTIWETLSDTKLLCFIRLPTQRMSTMENVLYRLCAVTLHSAAVVIKVMSLLRIFNEIK